MQYTLTPLPNPTVVSQYSIRFKIGSRISYSKSGLGVEEAFHMEEQVGAGCRLGAQPD